MILTRISTAGQIATRPPSFRDSSPPTQPTLAKEHRVRHGNETRHGWRGAQHGTPSTEADRRRDATEARRWAHTPIRLSYPHLCPSLAKGTLLTEPTVSTVQRRRGVPLTLTPSSTQCVSSPSTHARHRPPHLQPLLASSHLHFTPSLHHVPQLVKPQRVGQHGDRHSGAVRITYRCGHSLISWYPSSGAAGLTAGSNPTSCCWELQQVKSSEIKARYCNTAVQGPEKKT